MVWGWYEGRRGVSMRALPNAGHLALGALERHCRLSVLTQNVDDLHERAGSSQVVHLHGSLFAPRCSACPALMPVQGYPTDRLDALRERRPDLVRSDPLRTSGGWRNLVADALGEMATMAGGRRRGYSATPQETSLLKNKMNDAAAFLLTFEPKWTRMDEVSEVKFGLKAGFNIGNYRVVKRIGSGCTAEAYLVKEVPTSVERVLKIYEQFDDNQWIKNLRDFEHYCWFLEEISDVGLLPRYYHMGHTFLRDSDGIGHYFMVQEHLKGTKFSVKKCAEPMVRQFRQRVAHINDLGYGVGDMTEENLLIVKKQLRMVDCNYGTYDRPNQKTKADTKTIDSLFGVRFGTDRTEAPSMKDRNRRRSTVPS